MHKKKPTMTKHKMPNGKTMTGMHKMPNGKMMAGKKHPKK